MSRRSRAVRRKIPEDPRYGSVVVQKFINGLMLDGKKSLAEAIFYDAMSIVETKAGQPSMNVFQQALTNAKPALEVKSRRVGGATYQVPIEVRPERPPGARHQVADRLLAETGRTDHGPTPCRRSPRCKQGGGRDREEEG